MADLMTVEIDATAVLRAFDTLGAAIERHAKAAAEITANNIAREARARLARATGARATGATAAGIRVEEARHGVGYVVVSERQHMPHLPLWLEHGTQYMTARPYLDPSVRLEQGAHDRRITAAIQAAMEEASR